jgi:ribonuclease H2 subunit B
LSQEDSASQEERATSQTKKKSKKIPICKPSQWVAIVPESVCKSSSETATTANSYTFNALKDPKTGSERKFLFSRESRQICEVLKCSDEPRSWFIGDSVQTDGSLLVCTPIDPLFLALPYLSQAAKAGKFTTLEAILDDPSQINSSQLEHYVQSEQWEHVCDVKVLPGDVNVYRYNHTKTMLWLKKKVERLSAELETQKVHVGPGSQSSALVRSKKQDSVDTKDYLSYACGIVCEYLSEDIATDLAQSYNFKDLKRTQEDPKNQPPAKKQRTDSVDSGLFSQQGSLDDDDNSQGSSQSTNQTLTCTPTASPADSQPLEDYTKYNASLPPAPPTKSQKQTQSQKALSKVDKRGMKSLSSFFGKKKT